ncbi:MAG TPA: Holliday junction resolvase RuvX [Longimicrobiales bacterium]|nr:Holliday junction resolvase RuvX [Longimicrobiales bacterium]
MGRVLAVDFGERRVGVAVSDPTGTIATPLTVITRRPGKRPPVQAIADLAAEHDVEHIVIGLPLTLEGEDSQWTMQVREFGARLAQRTGRGVSFADERLTSVMAERAVRSLGLKKQQREQKSRIDAAAAVIILQAFLDTMNKQTGQSPLEEGGAS